MILWVFMVGEGIVKVIFDVFIVIFIVKFVFCIVIDNGCMVLNYFFIFY